LIDPIFVGLLVAAFAFIYGELSRVTMRMVEINAEKEEVVVAMEYRDREVYEGDKGRIEFVADYARRLGCIVGNLLYPLVPYVLSIPFLFIGYGLGIELCAVIGVVLLVEAFLVCGVMLSLVFSLSMEDMERFAEQLEEEFAGELEE